MKILLVSNFYYDRGGDCTYLFLLKKLLEEKGHKVIVFSMNHPLNFDSEHSKYFVSYINFPDELKNFSISSMFDVLSRTVFSLEAKLQIEKLIEEEKPDIAHLQNIYHHITPSVFYSLRKNGIPIVWTLHDYNIICPNTSFLSHDIVCERCKKRRYYWPSLTKCKKNSFGASTMAAIETSLHRIMNVNSLVDTFITPSAFLKNKMIEYGFQGDNIEYLNNFNDIELSDVSNDPGDYYLYIGRLSQEKGLRTLLDAALRADSGRLKILGDGPLREELKSYIASKTKNNTIEFLGHVEHKEVIELLKKCSFVILPSECYENFPYSIIEAFACGKPVIASRLGGIPEIVRNWENGLLFEPGDSDNLSLKIKFLMNHPSQTVKMGKAARSFVEQELNRDTYYDKLNDIYTKLL
ncbi:MAG: glycosyltransferase [Promethearchaeota archaeon]|jgi:glycosyltransferase involved in cell wall biosynthesis